VLPNLGVVLGRNRPAHAIAEASFSQTSVLPESVPLLGQSCPLPLLPRSRPADVNP
jgi:hypothetical protein